MWTRIRRSGTGQALRLFEDPGRNLQLLRIPNAGSGPILQIIGCSMSRFPPRSFFCLCFFVLCSSEFIFPQHLLPPWADIGGHLMRERLMLG
jgi:hypothetical protein